MAVGLYVTSQDELVGCLPAACQFARAFGNVLTVFVAGRDDAVFPKAVRTSLKAWESDHEGSSPALRCQTLGDEAPDSELIRAAQGFNKLLLPHSSERAAEQAKLAEGAACTTVRLLVDENNAHWDRINVARDGIRHGSARRAAQRLCENLPDCELRINPLEPNYRPTDLVLIGTPYNGDRDAEDIAEAERIREESEEPPAVAVVLTGHSLTRRAYAAFENLVQHYVPQMERCARQQLTDDLQVFVVRDEKDAKGKSDPKPLREERFDFLAMISASAALAALGLVQDSAAVIIGAMLVAPLMSPILAASIAVVHSNRTLFRRSWRMITVGFLSAFAVSFLVGLLYPVFADVSTTREMASRCGPSFMDFLIGVAGGGAAAYARTRSQLSSALAGAAIAAALVPPVATAGLHLAFAVTTGMSSAHGVAQPAHPIIAPLLLFAMNVVSIMLAGAASLWAAGVRSYNHRATSRDWQAKIVVVLVIVGGAIVLVANGMNVTEVGPLTGHSGAS